MKPHIRKTLEAYKAKLIKAEIAEIPAIRSAFAEWYYSVSDRDRIEMKPFWEETKKEAWEMIAEVKEMLEELRQLKEEELAEARK